MSTVLLSLFSLYIILFSIVYFNMITRVWTLKPFSPPFYFFFRILFPSVPSSNVITTTISPLFFLDPNLSNMFFYFNLTTPLEIFEDDQQSCSHSLVLVAIVRPSFITDNHRLFVFASYYLFLCISFYIMHFVHSTSDLVIYCRGSLHKLTFQASTLRYYASIICTWKVVFVSLP